MRVLLEYLLPEVTGALVQVRNLAVGLEALGVDARLLFGYGAGTRLPSWADVSPWREVFHRAVTVDSSEAGDFPEEAYADVLARLAPDVLVVNETPRMLSACRLVERPPACVMVFHNQWVENWALPALTVPGVRVHAVCVSRDVTERLLALPGLSPASCRTILNGVDPASVVAADKSARKRLRERYGLSDSDFVVGFVGRLVRTKGIGILNEALAKIKDERVKLMIVGGGAYESKIRSKARGAGIESRVILTGFMADVRDAYAAMDAFALASLSEGLPIVLVEAMMCGLPVIVTPVGGIPEVVEHERSALFAHTAEEFADAIRRLAVEPELRARLAENAVAFARDNLTSEAMARQYLEVFEYAMKDAIRVERKASIGADTLMWAPGGGTANALALRLAAGLKKIGYASGGN